MEKGGLVKVCANPDCKVHFGNRQREEEQRLQFKAEKKLQTGNEANHLPSGTALWPTFSNV